MLNGEASQGLGKVATLLHPGVDVSTGMVFLHPNVMLPYPSRTPTCFLSMTSSPEFGWEGRTVSRQLISVSDTKKHHLRVSEVKTHEQKLLGRDLDGKKFLSDTIHSADYHLKKYLINNHPEWEECLRQISRENKNGAPGMLVSIDNMLSVSVKDLHPSGGSCYILSFAEPSLEVEGWNNRTRCVWIEAVEVHEEFEKFGHFYKSTLHLNVRDDTIASTIVYDELPYMTVALRQGTIEPSFQVVPIKADTESEKTAMNTLREEVTEREWRRYLRKGFIIARGSSGREYQIFRDKWHTKVRDRGKVVAEICARISGNVPPTDNVIAFKAMVETDEEQFKRMGNVYKIEAAC